MWVMCFQVNPGKSSLEGDTLTDCLCPEANSSTGKDEQTGIKIITQQENPYASS